MPDSRFAGYTSQQADAVLGRSRAHRIDQAPLFFRRPTMQASHCNRVSVSLRAC
jgi:hypothetical protein